MCSRAAPGSSSNSRGARAQILNQLATEVYCRARAIEALSNRFEQRITVQHALFRVARQS
jgi:hypothetical protein